MNSVATANAQRSLREALSNLGSEAVIHFHGIKGLWSLGFLACILFIPAPICTGLWWLVKSKWSEIFPDSSFNNIVAFIFLILSLAAVVEWWDELVELLPLLVIILVALPTVVICTEIWESLIITQRLTAILLCFHLRPPRFRGSSPNGSFKPALCQKCDDTIETSSLLLGAQHLIIWSFEKHRHHSAGELKRSSESCHLCSLLWRSAERLESRLVGGQALKKLLLNIFCEGSSLFLNIGDSNSEEVPNGRDPVYINLDAAGLTFN